MKKHFYLSATLLLLTSTIYATDSQLTLKHRESQGVGYNQGYSTVDYFLTSQWDKLEFMFNLRGHLFNDAKTAGNSGIGFRYAFNEDTSRIGVNAYYDFRDTSYFFANQISGGLEWISRVIDIRFNGYLPVGKQRSFKKYVFQSFSGNQMLVKRKFRSILPCIEGEVGTALARPFYFGIGTYYLFQESSHNIRVGRTWGGKARFDVDIGQYFTLGALVTHDAIFKTRVQGYISLSIPLGPWKSSEEKSKDLRHRPIIRNEIIPIQSRKDSKISLDSDLEGCARFIFVNNQAKSVGDGTFEHPFSSLKEAEQHSNIGDVIYVYPGDGTPRKMDEGIVLKDKQILASSKAPLTINDVVIPPQTPGVAPVITNRNLHEPIITNPGNSDLKNFYLMSPEEYIKNYSLQLYPIQPPQPPTSPWNDPQLSEWVDLGKS